MKDDVEAAGLVKGYLQPTDRIKWAGRPLSQITLAFGGQQRMVYAAVMAAITAVWLTLEFAFEGPILLKLAGIGVLLAAVVVGPAYPWIRAWRLRHTVYALTQNQVVIVENRQVTTVPLADIGRMEVTEDADGRGTLVFPDHRMQVTAEEFVFPLLWRRPTLFRIPDAADVGRLIKAEAAALSAAPTGGAIPQPS
ncbi:hypothetical protein [uncultured Alsobacter sp.]|uniref:hypothetical protein n=1 Tax=uncultured Alsobacter sp. TaxID=1748258 RepID=UPI0025F071B6|nr:hypothetical protein [uncultured Alsobacter sp.]